MIPTSPILSTTSGAIDAPTTLIPIQKIDPNDKGADALPLDLLGPIQLPAKGKTGKSDLVNRSESAGARIQGRNTGPTRPSKRWPEGSRTPCGKKA